MLAHNVFFTLKDRTPAARAGLVDACKRYLTGHPGTVFFACGTVADQYDREVNVRDFDVALHLVFATTADHDAYQVAPRHKQFVEEQSSGWASVRVFDSNVESQDIPEM